jgi:hypothetical protein
MPICYPTPYKTKTSPYGRMDSPYLAKISPYSSKQFCEDDGEPGFLLTSAGDFLLTSGGDKFIIG